MRVIGGQYKRRILKEVPLDTTRSTKDRVKESLFNMIMPYLPEGRVLDLFAGSGALGIEALSRGASTADFIEQGKTAFNVLKENIRTLKLEDGVTLHFKDAFKVIKDLSIPYELIILDPPYHTELLNKAISAINESSLLANDGIIAILCGKKQTVTIPKTFTCFKTKTIGITDVKLIGWRK